jgi:4-hydroxy-tetrahydrodipicolinate reductase
MKKYKVGLIGATGRMGKEISEVISEHEKFEAWIGVGKSNKENGFKFNSQSVDHEKAAQADLWIDFSNPEAILNYLPQIIKMKKPLVSGTTGFSDLQFKKIVKAADSIPLLWSPNMSLGIAILRKTMAQFAQISHFDFQIEEIHHKHKKDAPSGTALHLQSQLNKVITKKNPEPLSIRGGGVYGQHKVWALGEEEYLCYEHVALNRKVFAKGAIWASEKMLKKANGFYTFEDLLK